MPALPLLYPANHILVASEASAPNFPPIDSADDSAPSTPLEFSEPVTPLPVPPTTAKRRRGRPSRASLEERRLATPAVDGDSALSPSDPGTPTHNHATPSHLSSTRGKRRGRPPAPGNKSMRNRGGPSHHTQVPLDKDGNPQQVLNDEIVLPVDPAGETKVDENGRLQGGREYRCRTFTLLNRGDRLYMLSTEPARCIGFRDSYLFFQKHKQLFKIIVDDEEKYDMIRRDLIPHSYKGRAIGVVTARSVFREFGARIVVGGRKIIDDYFETRELEAGAVAGELADPADALPENGEVYNRNQYVAWHGASSVYHTGVPSVPVNPNPVATTTAPAQARRRRVLVTDANWMAEHAAAASNFNTRLWHHRQPASKGMYEPHTGLRFVPATMQPQVTKWEMVRKNVGDGLVIVDEAMKGRPFVGNGLGAGVDPEMQGQFGGWSDDLIDSLETEEEKEAVRAQVALERKWRDEMYN